MTLTIGLVHHINSMMFHLKILCMKINVKSTHQALYFFYGYGNWFQEKSVLASLYAMRTNAYMVHIKRTELKHIKLQKRIGENLKVNNEVDILINFCTF